MIPLTTATQFGRDLSDELMDHHLRIERPPESEMDGPTGLPTLPEPVVVYDDVCHVHDDRATILRLTGEVDPRGDAAIRVPHGLLADEKLEDLTYEATFNGVTRLFLVEGIIRPDTATYLLATWVNA